MIDVLRFRRPSFKVGFSESPALSFEADLVSKQINDARRTFSRAETLHGRATRELGDTFLDARQAGWDGYDAIAIPDEAYVRAERFLARILQRFPAPTASATPSGSLTFEWIKEPNRRFMVSIGLEDRIGYAGLFGSDPVYGTTVFANDIPQEIVQNLRRLFFL